MYCNHCGAQIEENAKFCVKCGKKVEIQPVESQKKDENAKEAENTKNAVKDTPGIKKESEATVNQTEQQPSDGMGWQTVLLLIGIVILLGVAGGLGYKILVLDRQEEIVGGKLTVAETKTTVAKEAPTTEAVTEAEAQTEEETEEDTEEEDLLEEDYILPDSDTVLLTDADVEDLTLQEINYAKNEIYARHGRKFDSKELRDYFESKSWYVGTIDPKDFSESVLSKTEAKNAAFLSEWEKSLGTYQLDQ